jgi:hypothetical protein
MPTLRLIYIPEHQYQHDDYLADNLLQEEEAIDEVNKKRTCSFGSQVPHEEMIG